MTPDTFVRERAPGWAALARLATRPAGGLSPAETLELARRHRSVVADLAFARRRFPGEAVIDELEHVVELSRASLTTRRPPAWRSLGQLVVRDYWRLVIEQPWSLLAAVALLLIPAALAAAWVTHDPTGAARILPDSVRSGAASTTGSLGLPINVQAGAATFVTANNISVAARAFAGGIAAGLGTAYFLVVNGVQIGGVAAYAGRAGTSGRFISLVAPHGILELSCLVLAGAAGLRMGRAIVDPRRRRLDALADEARRAAVLLVGTVPYFALAGCVEGFVTPHGLDPAAALATGVLLSALLWVPVVILGRGGQVDADGHLVGGVALLDA